MDEIRLGVIGCGYWGPNLLRNYVELPGVDVVAVADLCQARLDYVHAKYPAVQVIQDYQQFFSMGLTAAVISTPPSTHFRIAKDCLEHGLHVLVEKPLTLSSDEARLLNDISRQRGLTLMVGHTFEYNPAVCKLKEYIQSGELGSIYYLNSVRANLGLFQRDLDVVWDLAPHDISIFLYLLDLEPQWVSALGEACVLEDKCDVAYLHLQFPNKISAHAHISWLDPCKVRRITVVGSHKMAVYDDIEATEKLRIYDKSVETASQPQSYGEFMCVYHHGDVVIPHIDASEPLRLECKHFVNSIRTGVEPRSSGHDGWRVVKILEAAERSLICNGQPELVALEEGAYDLAYT